MASSEQILSKLPFFVFYAKPKCRIPDFATAMGETRFDLSNLLIQRYDDTAIASYTLLISTAMPEGVKVAAHNESRVIVKLDGEWKVAHVHKSPAWSAPHVG